LAAFFDAFADTSIEALSFIGRWRPADAQDHCDGRRIRDERSSATLATIRDIRVSPATAVLVPDAAGLAAHVSQRLL
jgi:hypothetical protein